MIVIKGNLIIGKSRREPLLSMILKDQIQKRTSPVYDPKGSNPEEIKLVVALATLNNTVYDTVLEGDITISDNDYEGTVLVTGEVMQIGGEYAS